MPTKKNNKSNKQSSYVRTSEGQKAVREQREADLMSKFQYRKSEQRDGERDYRVERKVKPPYTSTSRKQNRGFLLYPLEHDALSELYDAHFDPMLGSKILKKRLGEHTGVHYDDFRAWYKVRYTSARHRKFSEFGKENEGLAVNPFKIMRDFKRTYARPPADIGVKSVRERYQLLITDYKVKDGIAFGSRASDYNDQEFDEPQGYDNEEEEENDRRNTKLAVTRLQTEFHKGLKHSDRLITRSQPLGRTFIETEYGPMSMTYTSTEVVESLFIEEIDTYFSPSEKLAENYFGSDDYYFEELYSSFKSHYYWHVSNLRSIDYEFDGHYEFPRSMPLIRDFPMWNSAHEVQRMDEISAQINGSHGEYTGTDDVDNPTNLEGSFTPCNKNNCATLYRTHWHAAPGEPRPMHPAQKRIADKNKVVICKKIWLCESTTADCLSMYPTFAHYHPQEGDWRRGNNGSPAQGDQTHNLLQAAIARQEEDAAILADIMKEIEEEELNEVPTQVEDSTPTNTMKAPDAPPAHEVLNHKPHKWTDDATTITSAPKVASLSAQNPNDDVTDDVSELSETEVEIQSTPGPLLGPISIPIEPDRAPTDAYRTEIRRVYVNKHSTLEEKLFGSASTDFISGFIARWSYVTNNSTPIDPGDSLVDKELWTHTCSVNTPVGISSWFLPEYKSRHDDKIDLLAGTYTSFSDLPIYPHLLDKLQADLDLSVGNMTGTVSQWFVPRILTQVRAYKMYTYTRLNRYDITINTIMHLTNIATILNSKAALGNPKYSVSSTTKLLLQEANTIGQDFQPSPSTQKSK